MLVSIWLAGLIKAHAKQTLAIVLANIAYIKLQFVIFRAEFSPHLLLLLIKADLQPLEKNQEFQSHALTYGLIILT